MWILAGFRVQEIEGCAAPTYTPVDKQSEIVLNECDSLYRWRDGGWHLLNPSSTYWTVSDGTNSELITNQTVTFTGSGGAVVSYNPTTNTVTIDAGSSSGGDNWGSQVAITDASLTGDGTAGNALSINGYSAASNGTFPSKSAGGITWQTVDLSATNELQTLANTSNATTHTATLSNSGGSLQLAEGSGITLTTTGTTLDGIVTIAAVDASTTNESLTISDGTDSENLGGQTLNVTATGIASVDYIPGTNTLSIGAVEVDGSVSNELQTYAHSGTTSYTNTLSNGGGSFTLQSGGIVSISHSTGTVTISATEVDGSTTNEAWTIDADDVDTEVISNQTVKFQGAGIAVTDYNATTNVLLITATEVDGSVSNELQTFSNTSTATTHTVTLSNSGGSLQLAEGSGVTLTTTGTPLDGVVTIAAVDASTTNEIQTYGHSGTTSYTNTLSLGGGSFTLQSGGIVSISNSSGTVTISATEVDGSTTNELQTLSNTSDATSHTVTLSNSGGSVQLIEGSGITLATGGTGLNGTVTITATDASATNEAWTIDGDDADTEVISNQTVKFQGAGITTTDYNSTTDVMLITSTEVDGNVSNEGSLTVAAGASNTSIINSNTSGQTGVTLTAAGILTISESGNVITLTGTEVDGSTTNELQTFANTSNATTHTVTLSNSGGSIQLAEGAGITLTTTGTTGDGIVTIAATGGGITGAQNGLYVSGSNVRMGTNPLIEPTIIDHNGFEYRHSDGKISLTNQGTSYTTQGADFGVEGIEAVPTLNSTPTKDGIIELRASNAGSAQPNSLTIGAYTTDADGVWIQARSHSVPNFEYPLSLQPRGGQMSVGRFSGLDALVTFSGTGLAGSGIAGQVLHLENNEGNGKTSMSMGAGTDALDSEVAWFDASDALRITNRSNVTGTSTVRIAVGGETSDKVIVTNAGMGVGSTGTTAILSTLQVEGSLGLQTNSPGSSTTLTAANNVLVFLGSSNATFTLPTASTVDGRVYWIMNHSAASTVTLSQSVTKANGSTFTVINPRQTALIIAVTGNGWRGSLWTSE